MICPKCNQPIKTNGIGPSGSPKFNWVLRNLYRFSCRLFHKAGNGHDCHYHIDGYGKTRADREFLRDMLQAVRERDCNWFTRRWFKYQANKFYLAVKIGGQSSYDAAQKVCITNQAGTKWL